MILLGWERVLIMSWWGHPKLARTIRHADPGVRQETVDALGQLGESGAVRMLLGAVKDRDNDWVAAPAKVTIPGYRCKGYSPQGIAGSEEPWQARSRRGRFQ